MLNFLCKIDAPTTFGEKLEVGGLVALIGIVVVFIILAILILCIKLFEKLNSVLGKKESNKLQSESVVSPQNLDIFVDDSIENNATVAAIIGALSIVLCKETASAEQNDAKFVVKSIKKFNSRRF